MYNGIGLQTARGSGTSGYVQANLSSILLSKKRVEYNAEDDLRRMEAEINKKPNEELLQHARKRAVEMKCVEFEMLMEEKGFDEEEIGKKVNDYRKLLLSQLESGELNLDDELDIKNSHARMQYAAKGRDRMRDALGLAKDFVPGSSMEGMKKSDVVDAALTPAPSIDEKPNMLATLKEMKKKEKEKKNAKKEEKKKRKRKESTSSSSSDSDSDSDSDTSSSDSSSSDSSEDEKKKSKHSKNKKAKNQEREIKRESDDHNVKVTGHDDRRRLRSPENKRRREDRRNERERSRSPQHRDRRERRRSPPRRERRDSRTHKRRDSSTENSRKVIKEEPASEVEHSPPRRQSVGANRRGSDSYSSDEGHNRQMRSMVTKK